MATPNETNSGPSGESATLLHTALFKQVSSEEVRNCCRICSMPNTTRATIFSAKATLIIACICWNAGESN